MDEKQLFVTMSTQSCVQSMTRFNQFPESVETTSAQQLEKLSKQSTPLSKTHICVMMADLRILAERGFW